MDKVGIKDLATFLFPISVLDNGQLFLKSYQVLYDDSIKKLLSHSNKAMVSSLLVASLSNTIDDIVDLISKTKVEAEQLATKAKDILGNKPLPKNNNKRKREYEDAFRYQGFKEASLARYEETLKRVQEVLDIFENDEIGTLSFDDSLTTFRALVIKLMPVLATAYSFVA